MSLCLRSSGHRLRLAKNRPSRDMKSHFQSLHIPFWRRAKLPYIFIDNRLFYVAEVGIDAYFHSEVANDCVNLIWIPD
jgi:tRNA(Ile)-lysidine synthase